MDFSIKSKLNEENNYWEISVEGEIDIFNSSDFKTELLNLLSQKELDLKIDCTKLKYIDSTGLGALIPVLKKAKSFDKEVCLFNLKPNLIKLFKITNLDKVFKIEGDYDARDEKW